MSNIPQEILPSTRSQRLTDLRSNATFTGLIELLELKEDDIEFAEPEDIVAMAVDHNPNHRILAKRLTQELFKNDLSPKGHLSGPNNTWSSLNYEGKCKSSAFVFLKEYSVIYFCNILDSLKIYAKDRNLVYINFFQCYLLEEDLHYIENIVKTYQNLKGIDLEANRIQLLGGDTYTMVNYIFSANSSIMINFNGNYCETDRSTLCHIYGDRQNSLINGYIWIFEAFFNKNGWKELLKQFGLSAHETAIYNSHLAFFKIRKTYGGFKAVVA